MTTATHSTKKTDPPVVEVTVEKQSWINRLWDKTKAASRKTGGWVMTGLRKTGTGLAWAWDYIWVRTKKLVVSTVMLVTDFTISIAGAVWYSFSDTFSRWFYRNSHAAVMSEVNQRQLNRRARRAYMKEQLKEAKLQAHFQRRVGVPTASPA
jgi:hypothetical protein